MRGTGTFGKREDRKAATGSTQSFISDPYGNEGFLQLSHGAVISLQMHSTDSECLSARLKDEDV